jgi:transposase-like protein
LHYVPRIALRKTLAAQLREIFQCSQPPTCRGRAQKAGLHLPQIRPGAGCLARANRARKLTVFSRPKEHRLTLRTSNLAERVNHEIKRRTRVARIFPNPKSLLRLVSAVLSEISDDWETSSKLYLNMNPPSRHLSA